MSLKALNIPSIHFCRLSTWYAIEYIEEQNVCYGYVTGMAYDEFGYFSIHELESLRLPLGLKIERDLYFDEIPFNDLKA